MTLHAGNLGSDSHNSVNGKPDSTQDTSTPCKNATNTQVAVAVPHPRRLLQTHPKDSTHPRSIIVTQSACAGARVIAASAGSASARNIRPSDIDVLTWVPLVKIPSGEAAITSQAKPSSIQVTEDSQDISWEGIIRPVRCWPCKIIICLFCDFPACPGVLRLRPTFPHFGQLGLSSALLVSCDFVIVLQSPGFHTLDLNLLILFITPDSVYKPCNYSLYASSVSFCRFSSVLTCFLYL